MKTLTRPEGTRPDDLALTRRRLGLAALGLSLLLTLPRLRIETSNYSVSAISPIKLQSSMLMQRHK